MTIDEKLISLCIKLSEIALSKGDAPFGSVIADKNGRILTRAYNQIRLKGDITRHAEILAMKKAQKKLGKYRLDKGGYDMSAYTLYSNCEPCPMCSFMARELKFGRIVYAVSSPFMGGVSKWNIIKDNELIKLRPLFSRKPKVVNGVLKEAAMNVYRKIGWDKMFK
jgi:tRNA(adenine34) deaminase